MQPNTTGLQPIQERFKLPGYEGRLIPWLTM